MITIVAKVTNCDLVRGEKCLNSFLSWIERRGNQLPDPVFLFLWLIFALILISLVTSFLGLSAFHPTQLDPATGTHQVLTSTSLLSSENIARLWVEMPTTFMHFYPLGYVLVVMLGAGVAERAGLFSAAMRAGLRNAPKGALTPLVVLTGMMGNLASDAAYVVLIPLAGFIFYTAGRHPIVGIAAAFAGVSGGFSANLLPGQLDALLLGITQASVENVFGEFAINIAGNWFFIVAMVVIYLPVIWFVTDRMIEPRLGKFDSTLATLTNIDAQGDRPLTALERQGLMYSGFAAVFVIGLWVFFTLGPGTPFIDEGAKPEAQLTPFYKSLVAGSFLLFFLSGWAYGKGAGSISDHRDVVRMMTESMQDLSYYLVLSFVAAHFVAMFAWSNLGLILAVYGADFLGSANMPAWALLTLIILLSALLNLFVGSASAKWALIAPVMVPMLLLLGISPEMATAAYRVGDSATNIITPLMVYFPLILIFCQRWQRDFGLGSLAAMMLPYSLGLLAAGLGMTIAWVVFDLPLGPGTGVFAEIPGAL
ncbi:MAG TPA: hypothetical protein DD440_00730 [Porticoccaceae bacterium]|nr:hypothetical protein [Porticoccaceae bacterium]